MDFQVCDRGKVPIFLVAELLSVRPRHPGGWPQVASVFNLLPVCRTCQLTLVGVFVASFVSLNEEEKEKGTEVCEHPPSSKSLSYTTRLFQLVIAAAVT